MDIERACPFCGGPGVKKDDAKATRPGYHVRVCMECGEDAGEWETVREYRTSAHEDAELAREFQDALLVGDLL